jgi:hypothetical protein
MRHQSLPNTWSSPEYLDDDDDVTVDQYTPGDICWLKPQKECNEESSPDLADGCFNHPAVFLWTEESRQTASIFLVS